jgi:hypothetical protein
MDEQVGPRAFLKDLRELLPQLRSVLRDLPAALHYLAEKAK